MTQLPEAFTFGDITYTLPVSIANLTELKIVQIIGDHGKIFLKGIAPDTLEPTDIEQVAPKSKIEIHLPGRTTPYFAGVCINISMSYQAGFKIVEIEGRSWTYELDIVKKNRSYQKLDISYDELVKDVLTDYAQKDYRVVIPDINKYMHFAVQYQETAWEFLKRIAAREGTVLVAEYADPNHQPRFWLGLPESLPQPLTVNADKITNRDNGKYLDIAGNHDDEVKETDFITYETTSYETLHLGETVDYAGKELTVIHILSQVDKGLLKSTYTLAPSEKIALTIPPENIHLKGLALSGKVLERSGINIKIHLDIDNQQDKATAIWFPYAADTNNLMYCMPHEGEVVNLYFRDGWEDDAIAISGARGNGQSCQKTGDYNHRYFTNHERKELYLSPDTLSFTADESAANKITVKMTEQGGIDIVSAKDIVLGATGSVNIKGKTISVEAGSVELAKESSASSPGLYASTGIASIVLKDNKPNFYGKPVKVEGRNKAACSQPEEVPADEEEEKMTATDWLQLGLTVASFIPGLGTAAALIDAGISAARGDYAGAALSLGAAIPFAGAPLAVAKAGAKLSKTGIKIFKVLNAGKKMMKCARMIKPTCLALGKGLTLVFKINMLENGAALIQTVAGGDFNYRNPRELVWLATTVVDLKHGKKPRKKPARSVKPKRPPRQFFSETPISWTATRPKGTQQTYNVYKRNDINWNQTRTAGDKNFIGKTNAEAAAKGLPPQLPDGNFATLHHIGQDSRGPLAEASTRYHGVGKYGQDTLHSQYGKNTPNPNFPIDRSKFSVDTREYWKWRAENP